MVVPAAVWLLCRWAGAGTEVKIKGGFETCPHSSPHTGPRSGTTALGPYLG